MLDSLFSLYGFGLVYGMSWLFRCVFSLSDLFPLLPCDCVTDYI